MFYLANVFDVERAGVTVSMVGSSGQQACNTISDFETRSARFAIARLLRRWLSDRTVSLFELKWSPTLLRDLGREDAVINAACLQMAKLLLGPDASPRLTQEKAHGLRQLADRYVEQLGKQTLPEVEARRPGFTEAIEAIRADKGQAVAEAACSRALATATLALPGYGSKADFLLWSMEQASGNVVLPVADTILAGIFLTEVGLRSVFVEERDEIALLLDVLSILGAEGSARRAACETMRRLHAICTGLDMPETLLALRRAWVGRLASPVPLVDAREQGYDRLEACQAELRGLIKLRRKAEAVGGWVATDRINELLDVRESRLTGRETFVELVSDLKGVHRRLDAGLKLAPLLQTEKARLRLGDWAANEIEAGDFEDRVIADLQEPIEAVGVFGYLAGRVSRANLHPQMEYRLLARLGNCQEARIRREKVFTRIRNIRLPEVEKGLYLLELLQKGVFVPGRCQTAAIKLMLELLPDPAQIEPALDKRGEDPEAIAETKAAALRDYERIAALVLKE